MQRNKLIIFCWWLCFLFITKINGIAQSSTNEYDALIGDTTQTDLVVNEDSDTSYYQLTYEDTIQSGYKQFYYDSTFKKNYQSNEFQYEDEVEKVEEKIDPQPVNISINFGGFADLFIYLAIGLLAIALIYLAMNLFGGFSFRNSSVEKIKVVENTESQLPAIELLDFKSMIEKAKQNADFRLAVRYYFLWYLKDIASQKHILFHYDKTNVEYFEEIKAPNIKDIFSTLSYWFEWIWYGNSRIDAQTFEKVEAIFLQNINSK